MTKPNPHLRAWLKTVSTLEARAVAKAAGTSVPHLRHVAAGRRKVSAALAQRLAHVRVAHVLPLVQTELCDACSRCPLIK